MATRFKITKISRGVMLQISRITFYLSVDESETMARLLNEAIKPIGGSIPVEGPRANEEGPEVTSLGNRPLDAIPSPEASKQALNSPENEPLGGPRANEEAEGPESPITEALEGPEASSPTLEPREERPRRVRPRHSPIGSEQELKGKAAAALVTNRNKQ